MWVGALEPSPYSSRQCYPVRGPSRSPEVEVVALDAPPGSLTSVAARPLLSSMLSDHQASDPAMRGDFTDMPTADSDCPGNAAGWQLPASAAFPGPMCGSVDRMPAPRAGMSRERLAERSVGQAPAADARAAQRQDGEGTSDGAGGVHGRCKPQAAACPRAMACGRGSSQVTRACGLFGRGRMLTWANARHAAADAAGGGEALRDGRHLDAYCDRPFGRLRS